MVTGTEVVETEPATAPTLQIQTVLYKLPRPAIVRFLEAIAQAAKIAKEGGSIGAVVLRIGDCSPMPSFAAAEVATMDLDGVDEVTYAFFDENLGSAEGHNRMLGQFQSDLLLIVNPDAVASPYLISELTLVVHQAKVGMVEARQIPIEHPKDYDPVTGETSWATTACAMLPKAVVDVVGRFDAESFFLYCDDVDYSWRVRQHGYKVIFHPPARIFHDKRLNAAGQMEVGPAEEFYAAEAALMMAHKWSRPDLVEEYLGWLTNGTDLQRKAATQFRDRRTRGALPTPVDPDHRVAQFHGDGQWARHRW